MIFIFSFAIAFAMENVAESVYVLGCKRKIYIRICKILFGYSS